MQKTGSKTSGGSLYAIDVALSGSTISLAFCSGSSPHDRVGLKLHASANGVVFSVFFFLWAVVAKFVAKV